MQSRSQRLVEGDLALVSGPEQHRVGIGRIVGRRFRRWISACPFSRLDQRRDCRGSLTVGERRVRTGGGQPTRETVGFGIEGAKSKLEAPIGERLDSCQRFLERARKRVISAESAISEAVAEKDRLIAELAEGEKRMEGLREEVRAAPTQRDLVGVEFLDNVAQMRQEILESIERRRGSSCSGEHSANARESAPTRDVDVRRTLPTLAQIKFGQTNQVWPTPSLAKRQGLCL